MTDRTDNLLISVPEAARLLNVSTRTAYNLAHRAGFPAFKISENRLVVSRTGLEAWIAAQLAKEGA